MYLKQATTAGELQHLLRGVPSNTPLRIEGLTGVPSNQQVRVGYGTDPRDLTRAIVVLDFSRSDGDKS